jgi:flagellar motility protein MotE (MotC chaperone)
LPSAIDHRPLDFLELQYILNWKSEEAFNILKEEQDLDNYSQTYSQIVKNSDKLKKARDENQKSLLLQKQKK